MSELEKLRTWRAQFAELGKRDAVGVLDELIARRLENQAAVDKLAVTNPGSARLLARRLGLLEPDLVVRRNG